jgi:hypothetical protein
LSEPQAAAGATLLFTLAWFVPALTVMGISLNLIWSDPILAGEVFAKLKSIASAELDLGTWLRLLSSFVRRSELQKPAFTSSLFHLRLLRRTFPIRRMSEA